MRTSNHRWRVGYLAYSGEKSDDAAYRRLFVSTLQERGYVIGRNLIIDFRYADGNVERLDELARELIQLPNVDILVGGAVLPSLALKRATDTIPIVSLSCDAVAAGLVSDLARPGGNVTGVSCRTPEVAPKRLQLLAQIRPGLKRVGLLWNPGDPAKIHELAASRDAARRLGLEATAFEVVRVDDFGASFEAMRRARIEAVSVLANAFMVSNTTLDARYATGERLPSVYPFRIFVEAGGLAAYGPDLSEMVRIQAGYVDKILSGAKPSELPIEEPTKFELVINAKAAKLLGIAVPPSLLLRADHVIE